MPDPEEIINTPIRPEDYASVSPGQVDMDDELELDDEIDPVGDLALDEIDDEDFGIDDEDFDKELETDDFSLEMDETEIEQPEEIVRPEEQVKWSVIQQDNNDIVSKHADGFVLMARPLSAKQGDKIKYISRLSKDNKVLESGVIWIDRNEDARKYLENIADRILDKSGFVNLSKEEPVDKPEEEEAEETEDEFGGPGLGLDAGPDLGPELDFDLDEGEEIDLEGEDEIDLEDEEDIEI